MRRFMDRMKTALIVLFLIGFCGRVEASEGDYLPAYATTPSATLRVDNPSVTPGKVMPLAAVAQPEVTCTLRTTLPANRQAPMEVKLAASGKMNGKELTEFRYLFGDGESATGSGEVKHIYVREGSYQVRVTPVVGGEIQLPICKTKIVVKAGEVIPTPLLVATPSATATTSVKAVVQPKTGLSQWYWVSLGVLLVVWLGAVKWYRTYLV